MPGRLPIAAAFAALVAIWGSTWAAIRLGLEGIPPFTGVALRFALAGLILFVLGRLLRVPRQRGRRLYLLWAIETALSFCLSYGVVYWAEQWVPSGLAAVLFATFPLFVALLAHWWLDDERLTPAGLAGVLVGFGGVALIYSDDLAALGGAGVRVAAVVFLLSPAGAAVAHVLVKKWGEGLHPLNLTAVPMLATGVVMGAFAALLESGREVRFDALSVGALLYLALLGTAVTFNLYYWLLARVRATRVSLLTYGVPIVALAIGALLLDEPVTARTLAGTALVMAGVFLAT